MFSVDELTDLEENTPEFAAATFVMALKKRDLRFLREISRRNFNTLFPSDDCSAAAKAKAKARKLKKHHKQNLSKKWCQNTKKKITQNTGLLLVHQCKRWYSREEARLQ